MKKAKIVCVIAACVCIAAFIQGRIFQYKGALLSQEPTQGETILPEAVFADSNIIDLGNHVIAYHVPNNENICGLYGYFANDFTGRDYIALHDIDQNEIYYLPDVYGNITEIKMESAGELYIQYTDYRSDETEEVHIPLTFLGGPDAEAVDVMSFGNRRGKLIISSQEGLQSGGIGLPCTVWTENAFLGGERYDITFERISPVYDIGLITGGLYADYRLTVKDEEDDMIAEKVLVNYPVVYEEVHWLIDVSGDGSADIVFAFSDDWGMDALSGRTSLLTLIWKQETCTYEETMFPWLWQEQDGMSGEWRCPLWNQELSSLISFTGKDRYGRLIMDMYCFLNGEWRRVRRMQACYDENEYPASESPPYLGYYERIYSEAGDIVEETPIHCETGAVWFDEESCWSRYNENNLELFPDRGWEIISSNIGGIKIDKIIRNGIHQIVVGEDFFLVLYDDGSVWSWGNNEEGKLGIAKSFVSEPQRIEGLDYVIKLEDGGENVFALTEQGDVYTWGVKENVIPMKPVDSSAHIDTPFMMQDLKNIDDITAENGKLYALNKDGSLYVSDYPWAYGSFTNFSPLQEDVMLGEIGCMQAGAGNYDYFVRTDGSIFSFMSFFYEGYNSNAYAFIFPHEGEVEPGKNNVIAWPPLPEDIPEITVLSEGGKYECLIYYDLKGVEGVKTVSSDPYTVFLSKENGTLYYWNSDRIKYHDKEFVLTHPDTLREQCNGEFVEIRVADILDIDDAASSWPQIISVKSGKENTMFLTDDGQVFISKYVTYDTVDVEYGFWQVANPGRDPQTATYYDMALKELTFQKLELTDIQSIWTNGENCFCAVDSEGGYYRIIIEDNIITQTYLGLLPMS